MKKLFYVALALIIVNQTHARSIIRYPVTKTAEIIHFNLSKDSYLSAARIEAGQVTIKGKKIIVSLHEINNCMPGDFCPAVMPQNFEFMANIVSTSLSCGSVYYQAVEDNTIADGTRIEITVADHSRRLCKDLVPFKTEVNMEESGYNHFNGNQFKQHHYFGATELRPLVVPE